MAVTSSAGVATSDTPEAPRPSLVALKPDGSRPPLFLVHGGHGQIFHYMRLTPLLEEDQPAYGLEALGLWGDQPPQTTVEDMAERYIQEIREVQPEGPYTILAFSAGGVMGWEMAQQLRRAGETTLLGLLDAPAPRGGRRRRPPTRARGGTGDGQGRNGGQGDGRPRGSSLARIWLKARIIVFHLRNLAGLSTSARRTYWRELTRGEIGGERAGWLARRLGRGEGDRRVGRERPAGHFPVRRAHSDARRAYTVRPYEGHVTLFYATVRRPTRNQDNDRTLGWGNFTPRGMEIIEIPGYHEYTFMEPHVRTLAREITAWAARVRSRVSTTAG